MSTRRRVSTVATALLASTFLLMGCATPDSGSSADTESPEPAPSAAELEVDAAWLDEGRMAALITWGSSTCVPVAEEITADGQTVNITLSEGEASQPCTADLTARASLVAMPENVSPADEVTFVVSLGDKAGDADLDGNASLAGVPGEATDYRPTAGWYDDGQLVLLTWGSSTCLPIIDSIESSGNSGTVTFVSEDRPCTMDMVPRATIIDFGALEDGADDNFSLTLVGDNLDAKVQVVQG